jgi:hypothetical protein
MAAADALIAAEDEIAGLAELVRNLRVALQKADFDRRQD